MMFCIEILDENSKYVPIHWIHTHLTNYYFDVTVARKALRYAPSLARVVDVNTGEDVTGD